MSVLNNIKVSIKLIGGYLLVAAIIVVVAVIGFVNIQRVDDFISALYLDRLLPVQSMGNMDAAMYHFRGDVYKYMSEPSTQAATEQDIQAQIQIVEDEIQKVKSTQMDSADATSLADIETKWAAYKTAALEVIQLVKNGNSEAASASLLDGGKASEARKAIADAIDKLSEELATDSSVLHDQSEVVFNNATTTMWIAAAVGLLLAVALGVVLANSITNPLSKAVFVIQEMSLGRLGSRMNMERRDEIGTLTKTMDLFAEDLQTQVVASMKKIADGDLSFDPPVRDARDEIGPALKQTVELSARPGC